MAIGQIGTLWTNVPSHAETGQNHLEERATRQNQLLVDYPVWERPRVNCLVIQMFLAQPASKWIMWFSA